MNWFIDLPTRIKFLLCFGMGIALLIIVTLISGNAMRVILGYQDEVFHSEYVNGIDVLSAKSKIDEMRVALLTMMVARTAEERQTLHGAIKDASAELEKIMSRLLERNKNEASVYNRIEKINEVRLAFKDTRDKELIPLIYAGRIEQARKLAMGIQNRRYEEMSSQTTELIKALTDEGERHIKTSEGYAHRSTVYFMIFGVAAIIMSVFLAVFLNRIIARPLNDLSNVAEGVSRGDLAVNMPHSERSDEIGALSKVFRVMVEKLQKETRDITEAVNVLASSSNEIAATTAQLASGTQQTAVAVTETTTTVEEVKQTANASTEKARHVAELSQTAADVSQTGARLVNDTIGGINNIREQMEYIAETIVRLSEHNQAIGEIISAVDDLAEQSNLLAVNASIEAAKAGDQGKGFGVVAQEIKSLAEQSKQATKQVRQILNDIQKASSTAVMATEKGSKAVEATVAQSSGTGDSIRGLSMSIAEASQAVTQIAAANQQQLVGMDQVASAMANIKQATSQNASSTKQVEMTVRNLQDLGQKLKAMVQHYKL